MLIFPLRNLKKRHGLLKRMGAFIADRIPRIEVFYILKIPIKNGIDGTVLISGFKNLATMPTIL